MFSRRFLTEFLMIFPRQKIPVYEIERRRCNFKEKDCSRQKCPKFMFMKMALILRKLLGQKKHKSNLREKFQKNHSRQCQLMSQEPNLV